MEVSSLQTNTDNIITEAYNNNDVNFSDNSFFKKMENIMKHEDVKEFFSNCFNNDSNAKTSYMYIGMYVMLENQIKQMTKADSVEPKVIIGIIRQFINNSDIRHTICDNFSNWFKKNNLNFLQISNNENES